MTLVLLPGRTDHPLGAPPHSASATALALGGAVQPVARLRALTPCLMAIRPTERPRELAPVRSARPLGGGHKVSPRPEDRHRPPSTPNRARTTLPWCVFPGYHEIGPGTHTRALEIVRPVCSVSECQLDDLGGEVRLLGGPGDLKPCEVAANSRRRSWRRPSWEIIVLPLRSGKTRSSGLAHSLRARLSTSTAAAGNGIRCSRPFFMRFAGIAHVALSKPRPPRAPDSGMVLDNLALAAQGDLDPVRRVARCV